MVNMLLGVHCKKSDRLDLRTPLWNYISQNYSPAQANEAAEDLSTVQAQRDEVISLTGSYQAQLDCKRKYFRSLTMMESRFPISRDDHHVSMSFTWYDAFRPTKRSEHYSIHFEKACVLFNIGAVLTQQGLGCSRETETGVKQAASNFKDAAGVFGYLRDTAALRVEHPRPVDISPECAGMLERLCLAQSQECVYEKFCMDRKDSKTLAKLAKQVNIFYNEVLRHLQQPPLNAHFDKSWSAHVTVKAMLYDAEAWIQQGCYHNKETECNIQLACLKEAQRQLVNTRKEIKSVGKDLADHLKRLEDWTAKDYASAEKDNNSVYLQRVPQTVDPIPGVVLAKSAKPDWVDALGENMFTSVIPDSSAKALSKYTSDVDSIIREQLDALTHASDEARLKLRSWDLPDCLQALEAGSSAALPDNLRKELEDLEDHGGVAHLTDLASQIRDLRKVAQDELNQVTADLDKEAKTDGDLRDQFTARWTRPSSAALTSHLREKVAGYEANLKTAGESDKRLEARLAEHSRTFTGLSIQSAAAQLPRLQAPMVVTGDLEPAVIVADLRKGLEAISKLSSERAQLEEGLKQEKNNDNILPKLMAGSGNTDALFDTELKKYDPLKAKVKENLEKQHTLLADIQKNQAAYRQAFGYDQWKSACNAAAGGIRGKLGLYVEVRDNMSEGLRFYMSLQEAIKALQQQAGDYIFTRKLESEELMEAMKRASNDEARRQSQAAAQQRAQASFATMGLGTGRPPQAAGASQAYPPPYMGGPPSAGAPPPYGSVAQAPSYPPSQYPPAPAAPPSNASHTSSYPAQSSYPPYGQSAPPSQSPYSPPAPQSSAPSYQGSTPSYPPWGGGSASSTPSSGSRPQGYPPQQPPNPYSTGTNYYSQPQSGSQQPPPYMGMGSQQPSSQTGAPNPYGNPQAAWPPAAPGYGQARPPQQQQQQPPWMAGSSNPFTSGSNPPSYPPSQPYGTAPPNSWR